MNGSNQQLYSPDYVTAAVIVLCMPWCIPCMLPALCGKYSEEEVRALSNMAMTGKLPGVTLTTVQVLEPGKAYVLNGVGGMFNNTSPRDPDFFNGKMSNEMYCEMVNVLNEAVIKITVGRRKALQPRELPLVWAMTDQVLGTAVEEVNFRLKEKGIHCVFAYTGGQTDSHQLGEKASMHIHRTPVRINFFDSVPVAQVADSKE